MNKKQGMAALLCAVGVMGAGLPVSAEEAAASYELEEMVVTATRVRENADKVPASATVITAKDIEKINATTITDALKQIMGIFVDRPKGLADTANGIEMRGFGDADILVLYDGMPMNNAYDGGVNWTAIPVDDVERIEVVRGAASSLYGERAVGGVINIIPKEPGKNLKIRTSLIGGAHSTWRKSFTISQKPTEKFGYKVGFEQRSTAGFENKVASSTAKGSSSPTGTVGTGVVTSRKVNGAPRYLLGTPGKGAGRSTTYNAEISYDFDQERKVTYSYMHDKFRYWSGDARSYIKDSNGNPLFSGSVQLPTGKWLNFNESAFLDYYGRRETDVHSFRYRDEAHRIVFNAGVSHVKDSGYSTGKKFDGGTPGSDTKYPSKSYKVDFQKTWETAGKHTVVAGWDAQRDSMARTSTALDHWKDWDSVTAVYGVTGGKSDNFAAFVQDTYAADEHFSIYTGIRFDYYKKFDGYFDDRKNHAFKKYEDKSYTEWSPKLAFQYSPNHTASYYLSYGHSFTPPTLYKLYRTDNGYYAGGYIGNPDLEPETTDTFEIGVNKKFGSRTDVHLALFRSFTENLITAAAVPGTDNKHYVNNDKAVRTGMEAEVKHRFNDKWAGYVNYQWQLVKDDGGDRIYDYPKDILHAGLAYDHQKWSGYLDAEYVSTRNAPGSVSNVYLSCDSHTTLNAGLSYKFSKNWKAVFTVNNLLDREYYSWYKADGRNWYLGVQFNN
jgi:tonB-dependent receptor plug